MPYPIVGDQRKEEIKARQILGAGYTNNLQRSATESKIIDAIGVLVGNAERVTMGKVARMTGISKSNISINYGHLFKTVRT